MDALVVTLLTVSLILIIAAAVMTIAVALGPSRD
jgi:hypothetical protein